MSASSKVLESSFKNMSLVLTTISLLAGFSLAGVYSLTKGKIEEQKEIKKFEAIKDVLVFSYDNSPQTEIQTSNVDGEKIDLYPATQGGQFVGAAVKTFSNRAYSGKVWLMVSFSADGTIQKINVLEHTETPGLGTKMDTPKFKNQFFGKNPKDFKLKVKKDGGDVDAITAATVSSRAFSDAVARAYTQFLEYKKGRNL